MSLSTGITAATLIDRCICSYNAHNLVYNHFAVVLRKCGCLANEIVLAPVFRDDHSEFVDARGADFQAAAKEVSKLHGNVLLVARGRAIWKAEQSLFRQCVSPVCCFASVFACPLLHRWTAQMDSRCCRVVLQVDSSDQWQVQHKWS